MSTITLQQNAVSQLALQADAVGKLAQDTGAFAAVVAAFESNDPDALSWVLQRLELLPQCELICEWIRVKWCGLRCVEVCGPPDPKVPVPSLPEFGRALTQLASNEALLRRAVDAVSCGDADSFHASVAEAKLQQYCHLLCRYICSTLYRRICEVVCTRQPVPVSDAALDIRADAEVLRRLVANESLSGVIVKAAEALDCDPLRTEIEKGGLTADGQIICRLICTWRCVRVCRELCLEPPPILKGTYAVEEARNFALAARQLAGQPRALSDLTAAVISNNAQAYRAIVDRFGLGLYCWQVCGWVCSELCYEFCVCVSPPQAQIEWTNIGNFLITTDISAAGRTTVARSGVGGWAGGLNYAFYSRLLLWGSCPENSPLVGGGQMMYRFTYDSGSVTNQPIKNGNLFICQVGSDKIWWPDEDSVTHTAKSTGAVIDRPIFVCNSTDVPPSPFPASASSPAAPGAPTTGAAWYAAGVYIWPDVNGWVTIYPDITDVKDFMIFDTTTVVAIDDPNPLPATQIGGIPVPGGSQLNGADLKLTFQATRVGHTSTPDFTQLPPTLIRVNNAIEVNQLTLGEFSGPLGCCTPISAQVTVLFSVDHEEIIASGDWSLSILSQAGSPPVTCSPSAPGSITPSASVPGVVSLTARGGSGSVKESTGGVTTSLVNPISASASDTALTVASSAGIPSTLPFYAYLCTTDEAVQVTKVVANNWTVVRGQNGTTPEAALAGAEVSTGWCDCSYQVWLNTTPRLTDGTYNRTTRQTLVTFCICGP